MEHTSPTQSEVQAPRGRSAQVQKTERRGRSGSPRVRSALVQRRPTNVPRPPGGPRGRSGSPRPAASPRGQAATPDGSVEGAGSKDAGREVAGAVGASAKSLAAAGAAVRDQRHAAQAPAASATTGSGGGSGGTGNSNGGRPASSSPSHSRLSEKVSYVQAAKRLAQSTSRASSRRGSGKPKRSSKAAASWSHALHAARLERSRRRRESVAMGGPASEEMGRCHLVAGADHLSGCL